MIRLLISVEQNGEHMETKLVSRNGDRFTVAEEKHVREIVEAIQVKIADDGGDAAFVERPAEESDEADAPPNCTCGDGDIRDLECPRHGELGF